MLKPQVSGLLAAALVAWLACPAPPPRLLDWIDIFGASAIYVVLSLVISIAAVRLTSKECTIAGTASLAVWFAPLVLLVSEESLWAVVAAAVVGAGGIRLLYTARDVDDIETGWLPGDLIRYRDPPLLFRQLAPSLAASAAVQAGVVAGITDNQRTAAVLIGAGAAVLAWSAPQKGLSIMRHPRSASLRIVIMAVAAMIITAAGLARYLDLRGSSATANREDLQQRGVIRRALDLFLPARSGSRDRFAGASHSEMASARSLLNVLLARQYSAGPVAEGSSPRTAAAQTSTSVGSGGTYNGVILWPEIREQTTLIAPVPALARGHLAASRRPMVVPFYGAYWIFKPPDRRPPLNSHVVRGDPAEMAFRSTDNVPLVMQARQDLGTLFDLSCCSRIQLVVRNADRYSGTISVELILVNSQVQGAALSLGEVPVTSRPVFMPGGNHQPVTEALTFNISNSGKLRQFDQIVVLFHLGRPRTDRSAKVAIERLVLAPRTAY